MRVHFSLLLFIFSNLLTAQAQEYDRPTVSAFEIENSLKDTNLFRAIMLDNKFNYIGKIANGEEWQVPLENNDNGYVDPNSSNAKMVLKMHGKTEWVQSPKIVFTRSTQRLNGKIQRSIFVQIRKDLLPNYKKAFEDMVRKIYPIKTVVPVTYSYGTANAKEDFRLRYSRTGSLVKVEMTESPTDNWFLVNFILEEISNLE